MNNFWKRTFFGFLFIVVMVFGLTFDRYLFFILLSFIMIKGLNEFYALTIKNEMKLQCSIANISALAGFASVFILECMTPDYLVYSKVLTFISLIAILLIPVSYIFKADHSALGDMAYIYTALLYIGLPICLSPKIVMDGVVFDGWFLLSLFIIIWLSDIGAYCIGTAFGQKPWSKKLAPSISPKKSWWGFAGAIIAGMGTAIGLHYLTWLPFSCIHCIVVGLIISVGAVAGDLVESLWKRHFGVKDSGNFLPGHGGILDRFDSSLIAIPAACIYLSFFELI